MRLEASDFILYLNRHGVKKQKVGCKDDIEICLRGHNKEKVARWPDLDFCLNCADSKNTQTF